MSKVDEPDLGARLADAREIIESGRPPAPAITARGRRIRWQRRLSAVAGLAVVAAAITVPQLAGSSGPAPTGIQPAAGGARPTGRVVVFDPPFARKNVVAKGVTDGKPWTLTATRVSGGPPKGYGVNYGNVVNFVNPPGKRLAAVSASFINHQLVVSVTVRADVASLTIQLKGQPDLRLIPVSALGLRMVSVVLPLHLPVTNIIANGAHGPIAHAVPYPDHLVGLQAPTWLPPGRPGQARMSVRLPLLAAGAGVRAHLSGPASIDIGPWGRCIRIPDTSSSSVCDPSELMHLKRGQTFAVSYLIGGGSGTSVAETFYFFEVSPRVSKVQLRLSDGSTHTISPVRAGNVKFMTAELEHLTIARWTTFDAAGHQLQTGTGKSL